MDPALPSSRVPKLKKRFQDVLSGSVKLDSRGATLFLQGLCAQDDPVACLDAITKSALGLSSVQSAIRYDLSVDFMNGVGSATLQYLLRASDVGGDTLDNLLFHVVEPPVFWRAFVRTFEQGELTEDAQLVFAKVLSRLLTLRDQDTSSYRDIAARSSVHNILTTSSKQEIRETGHLIKHILSTTGLTVSDVRNGPGGRHDNDFVDYNDIAVLPTADEIRCQKPPFLRTALHDELDASETPVKDYLDNTFRMLREDMIFDIREEVQAALQENRKYRGLRVNVSMGGIYTGPNHRKTRWGVKLVCDSDFSQLKGMKEEAARVKFLAKDPHGSKILRNQSLVCLVSGGEIVSFGTVNRVEELLGSNPPVIVFQLDGEVNIRKTLTSLCSGRVAQLIQIATSVFAFEPVLTALKNYSSPLSEDVILWNSGLPIGTSQSDPALSHLVNVVTLNPSVDIGKLLDLPKRICLDRAQARSLVAGLEQRVSLIQGPPGTGKSFIGALLSKAIHDETAQTLLVVCYTNHALDQFLEDLLSYDVPAESLVRLGGRANQSTEHLSLYRQPRERVRDWKQIHGLKQSALTHENTLEKDFKTVLNGNLMAYLKREHPEFSNAFHVPLLTEDGMERVGPGGRAIESDYLFSRWKRDLDAGVLSGESHVQASARIWGMDRSSRQRLLDEWQEELVTGAVKSICKTGKLYNELQDAITRKVAQPTVTTLQKKRIIACTTTGAAIYADVLKQVGPEVLLVEEAGEILESHILTALSDTVNQMILIGDHKQLRPKVNNYQLSVERGEGFDLNRSLFERLILKGYPHETLSTQHRMRPEISAFVRELTYPELTDAPSTYDRPDVRGVQSNVIFVNHSHLEDEDTLIADRADGGTKSSKQNTYEVQMVLKIVRFFAQQGYRSEDIVVLTPYLGQLYHLRDALNRENDLILNDMDSLDLARAGLSPSGPSESKSKKNRIHLATIDNYQGEESNIVIASLTRSNKSNAIGFMDSPERLNVLLSRARNGLVLIGNSRTFLHSRKGGALWKRFFDLLNKGRHLYEGFPVRCERHPSRAILLKQASDFDNHCPDGGCTQPCGFMLACGHACSLKCHPDRSAGLNDPHDTSQCKHKLSAPCDKGHHKITWECRGERPTDCPACLKAAKHLEEVARQQLEAKRKREEEAAEHRRRMAEMEARLQAEKAAAEQREKEEEARKRQEEDERKEAEARRHHQEQVERAQLLEDRKAERQRQVERIAEAKRQARVREEQRQQEEEEARKRQEEDERREAEARRHHQEQVERAQWLEDRKAERQRQLERIAEAKRQARVLEEQRQREEEEARKRQEEDERREAEVRRRHQEQVERARWFEDRNAEVQRQLEQIAEATRQAHMREEQKKQEEEEARKRQEDERREAEARRHHQELVERAQRQWLEDRKAERQRELERVAEATRQARMREEQKQQEEEEARKRQEEDERREAEARRHHQELVERAQRQWLEDRKAERQRELERIAEAERQEARMREKQRKQEEEEARQRQEEERKELAEQARRRWSEVREAEWRRVLEQTAEAERKEARMREEQRRQEEEARRRQEKRRQETAGYRNRVEQMQQQRAEELTESQRLLKQLAAERQQLEDKKAKASEPSRCAIQ